jgi:radical SAM protein with 4Fe4S-binding SPASM domain
VTVVQRRLAIVDPDDFFPAYTVWELTLRCDQACAHCGSRAGPAREGELSTAQALEVVTQLKEMRTKEVVLIGGEAYLHEGFLQIVRALTAAGIRPTMTTGGRGITRELARAMKDAGIHSVSVSIDGLRESHDDIRQTKNGFDAAVAALDHLRDAGVHVASNINVNRRNKGDLEPLYELLKEKGVRAWQVQITVPLGRAADRPQMTLQPWDLLEVLPRIAALKERAFKDGIVVMPGNNLGYFGREEALLRSVHAGGDDHWQGCQAGRRVLGIESNGAVKGCPSLQPAYIGGNLQRQTLREVWQTAPQLAFTRGRGVEDLWGFCRECPYAEVCLGGCSFTAHALFGRPGNNPFCHFRAAEMKKRGLRERLVATEAADGMPFDHGLYEIVLEPFDAADDDAPARARDLVRITRPARARA